MSSVWDNITESPTTEQPESGGPNTTGTIDDYIMSVSPDYVPDVEEYNPYAEGVPDSVTEAQEQYTQVDIATQDYANDIQSRIIRDRNAYIADDNYQGMLDKTYTNQVYDYLKRKNNNADDSAWVDPDPEDDLFKWVPDWIKEHDEKAQIEREMKEPLTPDPEQKIVQSVYKNANLSKEQREIMNAEHIEHGNWNLLSPIDKAKYLLVPGSSATSMDDAPEWAKYIQAIVPSVMAAGGGAMVGSLIPVPGAGVITGIATGVLSYIDAVSEDFNVPIISEALEKLDILATEYEKFQGASGAAMVSAAREQGVKLGANPLFSAVKHALGGDLDLLDFIGTTAEVLRENPYLFDVAQLSYEVGADHGFDNLALALRNTGAKISDDLFGTNYGQRDISEVSRANLGRGGLEETMEGTYDYASLIDTYYPLFDAMRNEAVKQGMDEKSAVDFAMANMENYVLNYRGTSGLVNEVITSSIADPANLIPYVSGKMTEGIGKVTGDVSLQNAGRAAVGNPILDLTPGPLQPVVDVALSPFKNMKNAPDILKPYGSQGLDTILPTYKNGLRSEVDVNTLSSWQKRFAGIDNDGKISELSPFKPTGNPVIDYFRKLFTLTEDSKVLDISQQTTDFLGSALFAKDVELNRIPELVSQALGKSPITDDSPLAPFRNSAMLNTIRDSFAGVDPRVVDTITRDVLNYRTFNTNRAELNYVAQKLNMSVDDIFKALDNEGIDKKSVAYKDLSKAEKRKIFDSERQDLFKKIRDANLTFETEDGKTYSAGRIIHDIDVFRSKNNDGTTATRNPGKKQYSETYLKANIMENIANQMDTYNLTRYNIKPDSWATRTSNLMKSMQSIALLNFSTSYQVNNFLNNMLTRSVVGVGGIDPDFVNTVNAKRGLFFSRDGNKELGVDTYGKTSQGIKNAKKANDVLQKFDDLYNKATDKKILKGVGNIDVEGLETNAAFNIGANRYWDATWGASIPDVPEAWAALGITKDMKEQIFKVALDSASLDDFQKNLMGEVIIPKAASTLAQMLENNYDTNSGKAVRDFFSTKPWVQDYVDSFMETGDPRLIKKGFENLRDMLTNDVGLQNVVQMGSTFDDYRVRFADQGIGAAATAFEALNDLYTQIWIRQTKENGTLFLDRITGAIAEADFDKIYDARTKIQTNDYNMVRGYMLMAIGGMIEGCGMDTATGQGMFNATMKFYDIGEEYINTRHEIYQKYGKPGSKDYNFDTYKSMSIDACRQSLNAQLEATKEMHKVYVDYLRANLDNSFTGRIDDFEKSLDNVIKMKEAENKAEIKDLEKRIDTNYKRPRAKESLTQEKPRNARKQAIHDAYQQAAFDLKQLESAMQTDPAKVKSPMTLEQTLRLELLHDEAKNYSTHAGEFLEKYTKGSDPATVYTPRDFSNKNVQTSFVDYGMKRIVTEAVAHGLDPKRELSLNGGKFAVGEAVTLGTWDATKDMKFVDPDTKTWVDHPVLDHYQLLDPNMDPRVTGSKFSMARCEPYNYNGQIVQAGVYQNGKVIAYITQGMQQTVTVDGKTYPIIGISPDNPNAYVVYVGNKPRTVTPGEPKGITYTSYAQQNYHPGVPGSTPTIDPSGTAYLETSPFIRDALGRWERQALSDLDKAHENGSLFGKLTPDQRNAVYQYIDGDLRQAYNAQRFQTQRYAETMVDAALLNYSRRYGFDNMLTMIAPYQFWMTRSLMNWGKRMISQPEWFSMYARIERLIEKNKKDFLPTRLEGHVGIPMPNMGDGMGSAFFFDINNVVFPFKQFFNVGDYWIKNMWTVQQNTMTEIDRMYEEGEFWNGQPITEEMMAEAEQGKGELYKAVFKRMQETDETDTSPGGLVGTFFGPPVWFDMAQKHIRGKDKAISYSPMFRTGNLIKAVGDDTPMQTVTDVIGGMMQIPENGIRKALGIESNPDGNFADYGVVSNIANMLTEKRISDEQARIAIAEGPGNRIWDEALSLYRQQNAIRMQGGALAVEAGQSLAGNKDTSLGQIAGSALASVFGAKVLPRGEEQYRENQALYRQIKLIEDKDLQKEMRKKFWQEHPDHEVHNYSYEDDPDERLHRVLVDMLENTYYALPETQQTAVQRAYGPRFEKMFLDKNTRATDHLDDQEIIAWIRGMQGNVPELTDAQITGPAREAQEIRWYKDSVQGDYDRYIAEKDKKFPGIKEVSDGYYKVPLNKRDEYLLKNPMLQEYWDWQDEVIAAYPRLATYITDRSAQYKMSTGDYDSITQALMANLNQWTLSQLRNHIQYGWKMKPDAERTLKRVYSGLQTRIPYETWLKSLVK